MSNRYQQNAEYTINDIETLRILTDVRRQNILELLIMQPMTVKEISQRLSIPVSKLYYHVNMLEEKEMIAVVSTQVVSGIIEKTYLATARSYQLSDDLLKVQSPELQEQMEGVTLSLIDRMRGAFLESANAGLIDLDGRSRPKTIVFESRLLLNKESVGQFSAELTELVKKFGFEGVDPEAEVDIYDFFVMAFPLPETLAEVKARHARHTADDPDDPKANQDE